jgi:hypothetical protein
MTALPLQSFCSGFWHFPVPNGPNDSGFFSPLKAFGAQKILLIGIIDMSLKITLLTMSTLY